VKKFLQKVKIKLILLQCLALFFIIHGVKRIYLANYSDIFYAIKEDSLELIDYSITDVIIGQVYVILATLLLGSIFFGLVNWMVKSYISIWNAITLFVISFAVVFTGVYMDGYLYALFNSICYSISDDMGIAFYSGGTIYCLLGLCIFWLSFRTNQANDGDVDILV